MARQKVEKKHHQQWTGSPQHQKVRPQWRIIVKVYTLVKQSDAAVTFLNI